ARGSLAHRPGRAGRRARGGSADPGQCHSTGAGRPPAGETARAESVWCRRFAARRSGPRAGADLPGAAAFPDRPESADHAALRLADLRAVQQLLARGISRGVSVQRLALHRAGLSVPEDPARLAERETGMAGRLLVVQQTGHPSRLVAAALLVMDPAACGLAGTPLSRKRHYWIALSLLDRLSTSPKSNTRFPA